MLDRQKALQYARDHQTPFLTKLEDFVRIPSVSTDPEHKPDMKRAADFLAQSLKDLGMTNINVFPTGGHPIVYGESKNIDAGRKTVLVYGHYDVQPADPLELWVSDPFNPQIRGQEIFARGASDMKGQILAVFDAIESIQSQEKFPVNLKFIFEGEEEIGSIHFEEFVKNHKELLACDLVLNPDTGMISAEQPAILYGLRGLAYFEVTIYGPSHDLHSGSFGGVVANPAQVLCELIAGMHDADGHITLPGFYDSVRPIEPDERKELAQLPITDQDYIKTTGVRQLRLEKGFTSIEAIGARPTLEVNGFLSGFTGEGSKTVIPAKAMAKISTRLVPDQDPKVVSEQLKQYLTEHAPASVTWEVKDLSGGKPCITARDSAGVEALKKAYIEVWKRDPVYKREGGSVPVVGDFQVHLGADSVLSGFGLPDDNIHSPNEKLDLPNWRRGIEALIHFFYNL
jgi:acetylornithine deacetylase/succinyl-diaminopimelate desuccinylase-like protein